MLSIGVGTAAGRRVSSDLTLEGVEKLHAVRDDAVIAEVSNPSDGDLIALQEAAGPAGRVVTADDCCIVECASRCLHCIEEDGYDCCHYMRADC